MPCYTQHRLYPGICCRDKSTAWLFTFSSKLLACLHFIKTKAHKELRVKTASVYQYTFTENRENSFAITYNKS